MWGEEKKKQDEREDRQMQQRTFRNALLIPMRKIHFSLGSLQRKNRPKGQPQNSIPEASELSLSLKHTEK